MSTQHPAKPQNPAHHITVGWNSKLGTYFVEAFESDPQSTALWPVEPQTTISKAGFPNTPLLRTLYDLIDYTCNLIDWPNQEELLRQLAVDPLLEAYALHAHASLNHAHRDLRDGVRGMLQSIYGNPQSIVLPATQIAPHPTPVAIEMEKDPTGVRNRSA